MLLDGWWVHDIPRSIISPGRQTTQKCVSSIRSRMSDYRTRLASGFRVSLSPISRLPTIQSAAFNMSLCPISLSYRVAFVAILIKYYGLALWLAAACAFDRGSHARQLHRLAGRGQRVRASDILWPEFTFFVRFSTKSSVFFKRSAIYWSDGWTAYTDQLTRARVLFLTLRAGAIKCALLYAIAQRNTEERLQLSLSRHAFLLCKQCLFGALKRRQWRTGCVTFASERGDQAD